MRGQSGRFVNGLATMGMAAFIGAAVSAFWGNEDSSRHVVVWSLVCILCYAVYEIVVVRLLYFQIHLRRTRFTQDSLDMQQKVWIDIELWERRVGMVLLFAMLTFVGSVFKGFVGEACAFLLALVIIVRARKLKII